MKAKEIISIVIAAPCSFAAGALCTNNPTIRTAVKDGVIAVGDTLTGGMPDGLSLLLARYAVALVIAMLTAMLTLVLWWMCGKEKRRTAVLVGLGISLGLAAVGAACGSWQSAIAAAVGGFGCVACLLLYGVLTKKMPKIFNRETVNYIIFGVLTTVVSFVSHMIFADVLGTPATVNTIGSWVCAATFAYVVNKLFVFESRTSSAKAFFRELWLFFAARLLSLGLEFVFMLVTVDLLHCNEAVCKLIAQVFILIANYIFSKLIIFKKKSE